MDLDAVFVRRNPALDLFYDRAGGAFIFPASTSTSASPSLPDQSMTLTEDNSILYCTHFFHAVQPDGSNCQCCQGRLYDTFHLLLGSSTRIQNFTLADDQLWDPKCWYCYAMLSGQAV